MIQMKEERGQLEGQSRFFGQPIVKQEIGNKVSDLKYSIFKLPDPINKAESGKWIMYVPLLTNGHVNQTHGASSTLLDIIIRREAEGSMDPEEGRPSKATFNQVDATLIRPLERKYLGDQSDSESLLKSTESVESSDSDNQSEQSSSEEEDTDQVDPKLQRQQEKKAVDSMIRRRQVLNEQTGR